MNTGSSLESPWRTPDVSGVRMKNSVSLVNDFVSRYVGTNCLLSLKS
jgi:hypothetical protein